MKFGLIIAGLVFFLNPNINIIDIFPDFIGCALIYAGLAGLAPLSPSMEDGLQNCRKLLIVNLFKLPAFILLSMAGNNEKTFYLVFTFTFALLEAIYFIPMILNFCAGFAYFGSRAGTEIPSKNRSFRIWSVIFIILHGAFTVIPETVYLTVNYDEDIVESFSLIPYKSALTVICALLTVVFSIEWICVSVSYFKKLRKIPGFTEYLENEARSAVLDPGDVMRRKFHITRSVICLGAIFMADFYVSGINLIPDPLCALFFLGSAVLLTKNVGKNAKMTGIFSGIYFVLSLISFFLTVKNRHSDLSTTDLTGIPLVFAVISSVLFCVTLFFLVRTLKDILDRHAGPSSDLESGLYEHGTMQAGEILSIRNRLNALMITGCIAEASSLFLYFRLYSLTWYWMINLVLSVAWIVFLFSVTADIDEKLTEKYPPKK